MLTPRSHPHQIWCNKVRPRVYQSNAIVFLWSDAMATIFPLHVLVRLLFQGNYYSSAVFISFNDGLIGYIQVTQWWLLDVVSSEHSISVVSCQLWKWIISTTQTAWALGDDCCQKLFSNGACATYNSCGYYSREHLFAWSFWLCGYYLRVASIWRNTVYLILIYWP